MIEEEQKELADYIKGVHLSLRSKSRQVGAELAWKEHVENEEVLRNYAASMKNLAEKYWSVNSKKDKCLCRIEWMVNTIREYFIGEGIFREFSKEKTKMKMFVTKSLLDGNELEKYEENFPREEFKEPYRALDVGSCYDPFNSFDFLETFPIDLCPAIPSVKKCDFTQLRTENENISNDWFHDNLQIIPKNFFDIVIFSLFLEYLPSPEQRYQSCLKAYESLKTNGLLLIATPDSKHESANAGIMKNWKLKLAQIGFVRVKLEKLKYMYCMAFRKSASRIYPKILYNVGYLEHEKVINIPQDFVEYKNMEKSESDALERNEENLRDAFGELPFS